MSYRIIKNSASVNQEEKLLQTVDAAAFMERRTVVEDSKEETDPCILLEDRIRKDLEEETDKARKDILARAHADMEVLREATRLESAEAGYREGFQKGYEEGQAETDEMRSSALERIASAEKAVKAYLEESEERILRLSVRIAEKIVHQTLNSHAEGVMLLARPILQEYGKTEKVILSCHPDQVDSVREHMGEIEKYCPNAHILILEDKSLEQNGLVIENEDQIADLQVKKQLERFLDLAGR